MKRAKITKPKDNQNADKHSGSGNYENDIPIDGNVVSYKNNKTAREEGKAVALTDNKDNGRQGKD